MRMGERVAATTRNEIPVPAQPAAERLAAPFQRGLSAAHSIAHVTTHAPAEAEPSTSPAEPVAPLTAASGPVQLAPNWRKLLAGAGAVLGTGALIAGGVLGSPALAVGGGLGLLAGGGYLAKKAWDKRKDERRRRGELEDAVDDIRRGIGGEYDRHDTGRSAVLSRILTEASGHYDIRDINLATTEGRGEIEFGGGPLRNREYEIRVNPDEPILRHGRDPAKTRSTVLHELTHVAVDQGYGVNVDREGGQAPANYRSDESPPRRRVANEQALTEIRRVLATDHAIDDHDREFIDSRLEYAHGVAGAEHDTVVNELLYFLHLRRVPEGSATSQGLTQLAHEAYLRRTG